MPAYLVVLISEGSEQGYRESQSVFRHFSEFIFQEYNIIDSFTVLENVELSLMGIDDLRELLGAYRAGAVKEDHKGR